MRKAFDNFKIKEKVSEVMFFDMSKYVYFESVSITLHLEIKHKFNKISLGQNKRQKNALFFSQAPTHHSFTFNLQLLYKLKHKVHLSKTVCGIFHFQSCFFFL